MGTGRIRFCISLWPVLNIPVMRCGDGRLPMPTCPILEYRDGRKGQTPKVTLWQTPLVGGLQFWSIPALRRHTRVR